MSKSMDKDGARTVTPMVYCGACASPLVQAIEWEQEDDLLWGVRLWCPDCEFEQAAVLDRPQLVYLSLAIEEGFAQMFDALAQFNALAKEPVPPDLVQKAQTDGTEPTHG